MGAAVDPTPDNQEFAEELRRRRRAKAWTQIQLAEQCLAHGYGGIKQSNISQWETGRHLPVEDTISRLEIVLECPGDLFAAAGRDAHRRVTRAYRWTPADCLLQVA